MTLESVIEAVRHIKLRLEAEPVRISTLGERALAASASVEEAAAQQANTLAAQTVALQAQTADHALRLDAAEANISSSATAVAGLQGAFADLQSSLQSLEVALSALSAALSTKSTVSSGMHAGASFTLTSAPGRVLMLFAAGAWGGDTAAHTVTIRYNGVDVASHPLRQASTNDRIGVGLVARVEAVASTVCELVVTGGTLYDPVITWVEIG
jgi:hypothetical protein